MNSRNRAFRVLPAVIWSLLVVALLTVPGDEIPQPDLLGGVDKLVHALLFGIHYGLLVRALAGGRWGERRPAAAVLASGLFAILMETLQLWVPGRGWEGLDLVANFTGIALVALIIAGRRARLAGAS